MTICSFDLNKFNYDIESNLNAMGLPAPQTLWGSTMTIAGVMTSIQTALEAAGADVPLSSIVRGGNVAKYVVAAGAAYYTGAVIGSAIMASNRATSCSASELNKAFTNLGFPSWAADEALRTNTNILRKN